MVRLLIMLLQLCAFPVIAAMPADELQQLKDKLRSSHARSSCMTVTPLARAILAEDSEHVLALQTIVKCMGTEQNVGRYAAETKEIFENSRILSIVPKLLEVAQLKDLVPILKEVEVKKDKSLTDYLMINEIYDRL